MMHLDEVLSGLRMNRSFMSQVEAWERIPARVPRVQDMPDSIPAKIRVGLSKQGIDQLYEHQAVAIKKILQGEHVVVATATASGKSLCYTIPVLQRSLMNPVSRTLYLFPTKALSHDQQAETKKLIELGELPVAINSYDGDTPRSQRRQVRSAPGIIISNPDMLHAGILPQHTAWRQLFSNLEFVVIDEIHAYRGVFGSHVANVIRRLQRLCQFYGFSNPPGKSHPSFSASPRL